MPENGVLADPEQRSPSLAEERAARRVQAQQSVYAAELDALIDAAFTVVGRTGTLDAPVRQIMREAGLSNQAFYRHVDSKDELLLLMLDRGRRALVDYLDHQIASCAAPGERAAEWIRGVLAQAADEDAARRTRPFIAQVDRLAERFPDEQRRSENLLIDQFADAADVSVVVATAVYDLAFGALARHLRRGVRPDDRESEALIAMALRLIEGDHQ